MEDGVRSLFSPAHPTMLVTNRNEAKELHDEARGAVQLVECLPSMHEALSLSPSNTCPWHGGVCL